MGFMRERCLYEEDQFEWSSLKQIMGCPVLCIIDQEFIAKISVYYLKLLLKCLTLFDSRLNLVSCT